MALLKGGRKMNFDKSMDRRNKLRFPFNRELRYKLLENDTIIAAGEGETIDMSSGGVAFRTNKALTAGSLIELSISWPALLYDSCPMRLVVFGRVARRADLVAVCTVEKWEFRTGSRQTNAVIPIGTDSRLMRWLEYRKEVLMKATAAANTAAAIA
jgi:hypothetical protein